MAKGRGRRDKAVKRQYEDYPYPPRNPEDEAHRLIEGSPSHLDEVNHYLFGGRRDFSKPFRALVAGGGTGDGTIMLAQHLADRGTAGSVTYIDLSTASREVAQSRAAARGLSNIEFLTGSLLDLPDMDLGLFDYIDCCGVLHHLEDPSEGLKALTACLAEDGGMGLMLYATLGRTGVYPVQDALKVLTKGMSTAAQVKAAKALLKDLPATNWLRKNDSVGDHQLGEDAALYDLLLHPRDRSYLVEEIVALLEQEGLVPVTFIEPARYNPDLLLKDQALLKTARDLGLTTRWALAERLSGNIKTHSFYVKNAAHAETCVAKFEPPMIPILKTRNASELALALDRQKTLTVTFDGGSLSLPVPEKAGGFVRLIDGKRNLSDIQSEMSLNWAKFRAQCGPVYKLLNELNLIWLRYS